MTGLSTHGRLRVLKLVIGAGLASRAYVRVRAHCGQVLTEATGEGV